MATGTFTHNSYRTKNLTILIKTYKKVLKSSNLAYTMSLVQGQILRKYSFPCAQWAVLGSQGIVVKCTAAIFFPTEDWVLKNENQSNYNGQSQRTQTIQWISTGHNSNQIDIAARTNRGKQCMSESRSVLVLLPIGWESGTKFLNQSQSLVMQIQSRCEWLSTLKLKAL